jgi:S1-C subfamily serine protease
MDLDRFTARRHRLPVEQGLIVLDVFRGTGAASSGLRGAVITESIFRSYLERVGDIIVTVGGEAVATSADLQRVLEKKRPGDVVELGLMRDGRRMTVQLRLSERPAGSR